MTAIKVIGTIGLAFALITYILAITAMHKDKKARDRHIEITLTACALAQILGIVVIWI